jgi:predicted glutamine amidotransferase
MRNEVGVCELLGISINRPERPVYAFRGLEHGSKDDPDWRKSNPDGWGVACYPDDGLAPLVLKEAAAAHASPLATTDQTDSTDKKRMRMAE